MWKAMQWLVVFALCPGLYSQAVPVSGKGPDTSTGMVTTAEVRGILLDNDTDQPIKGMGAFSEGSSWLDLTLVKLELLQHDSLPELVKRKLPSGTVAVLTPTQGILVMPVRKKGKWAGGWVYSAADKKTGKFLFTGLEDGRYAIMISNANSGRLLTLVQKEKLNADEMAPVVWFEVKDGQSVDLGTVYASMGKRLKEDITLFVKSDAPPGTDQLYIVAPAEKKHK